MFWVLIIVLMVERTVWLIINDSKNDLKLTTDGIFARSFGVLNKSIPIKLVLYLSILLKWSILQWWIRYLIHLFSSCIWIRFRIFCKTAKVFVTWTIKLLTVTRVTQVPHNWSKIKYLQIFAFHYFINN